MAGQAPLTQTGVGSGGDVDSGSSPAVSSSASTSESAWSSPPALATLECRVADVQDSEPPTTKRDTPTHDQEQAEGRATEAMPAPAVRRPHLHRDVLQSIFAFLQRKEFALLTRVSRAWLSTAVRMPPRRWSVRCRTESALRGLLASPLRRHVRRLTYWSDLSASLQLLIADRMAHLDELECRIQLTPGMAPPHWPAKLTKLTLTLQLETAVAEEIPSLMSLVGESLVSHAPLVEEFAVEFSDSPLPGQLLAPLVAWPLKQLTFRGALSSSAYPIIRHMAHLTFIRFGCPADLVDLMSIDGPVPPLEEIQTSAYLIARDETVPLLQKLPTLRVLGLYFALDDPTPLVPVLRHLHTLVVVLWPCQLDSFVSTLQQATRLTDLDVISHQLTDEHLAAILPPMRQLQRLRLHVPDVRSLDFLSHTQQLAETLTHLELVECRLDPAEVRHLRPLRALVKLRLDRCCTSPLDADTRSTLTPGGAGFLQEFWPHLRTFDWTPK